MPGLVQETVLCPEALPLSRPFLVESKGKTGSIRLELVWLQEMSKGSLKTLPTNRLRVSTPDFLSGFYSLSLSLSQANPLDSGEDSYRLYLLQS